jgi:membrane-associated phospholipid phosphatase
VFDIDPIVWLQSMASPVLTGVMNGVSLLGYTRVYIGVTVLLVFALRMRAALALLVVLALNAAVTDVVKVTAEAPRPDWRGGEVQSLSLYAERFRGREADSATETEDSYGFPSGHVSATTAFSVGLAMLLGWKRRGWTAAIAWIGLMALSRMYLGRHFPGDVVGGVLVGLAVIGVAFGVLKLRHLARELRAHEPWPAHRVMVLALAMGGAALLAGLPDAGDAGRMLGLALGLLVLVRHDVFEFAVSGWTRALLVVTAAAAFAAAWAVMRAVVDAAEPSGVSALRLAASALPNAALLIVPALLMRHRAGVPFAWPRRRVRS